MASLPDDQVTFKYLDQNGKKQSGSMAMSSQTKQLKNQVETAISERKEDSVIQEMYIAFSESLWDDAQECADELMSKNGAETDVPPNTGSPTNDKSTQKASTAGNQDQPVFGHADSSKHD